MQDKIILDAQRLINTYQLENGGQVNSAFIELIRAQGDKQNRKTNVKAAMTDWRLPVDHKQAPYNQFFDFLHVSIMDSIAKIVRPIDYSFCLTPHSYSVTSLWGAIYSADDHTVPHNHFASAFSFCYYLKMNAPPSPLEFKSIDCSITPTEGMLIIFPGWMDHSVPRNTSPDERIVLAGNVAVH